MISVKVNRMITRNDDDICNRCDHKRNGRAAEWPPDEQENDSHTDNLCLGGGVVFRHRFCGFHLQEETEETSLQQT